ncbi:amino acid adenylation domain-containing protein [Micromonospora sp. WMMD998]|uniref:amino acid adenylation domain-containing protein n=1 Tax=Micromonospora sp. WMMD998 TaxID=3016092 RepID=UPI00249BC79B|nr:amino acid adenylation domain-containing protein [Micromonospora sp. WMMD998]
MRRPGSTAVVDAGGATTYRDLDRRAARYAAALVARGVAPGDRVVLWGEKSADVVALMQAVLRVGGVYVPVGPSNPLSRVAVIAEDCDAALIIAGRVVDGDSNRTVRTTVTSATELTSALPAAPIHHPTGSDDPAYILYTSGSTGRPKGVCISHGNALAFVEWAVRTVGVGPDDRLSNHAPFNFDLSVFDLYAAFWAQASVHIVPAEYAYVPERMTRFLHEQGITVWYSVPSALILMMRQGGLLNSSPPPGLRALIFAGEVFPPRYLGRLRRAWPAIRFWNWFGPTETNVCTSYEVVDGNAADLTPPPIGTASCGNTVLLDELDDDGTGEIVVSGPTVMLGYWGRAPQSGPYRTGDLGRHDTDGTLRYLGRRDDQVKIRGHRVELGEVEAVIASHPDVAEVAVLALGDGLDQSLHAFVIPAADRRPDMLGIRRRCAERLPTYMIVDHLHALDMLPRTSNGKVDRQALSTRALAGGGK